jgi:hypothetical protein
MRPAAGLIPHCNPVAAALAHLIDGKPSERSLDALRATPKETDEQMRALDANKRMTNKALRILRTGNLFSPLHIPGQHFLF